MFKNGHKDPAIVEYRAEFCKRWSHYLSHIVIYDENRNKDRNPTGIDLANGKKQIILITHNESTFYEHDWRKKSGNMLRQLHHSQKEIGNQLWFQNS